MEKIYIAFVDTPGLFASALHGYLKQKYIHVLLSLDENLDEAYSFGRRNPAVPLVAGYEREDKERILRSFPDADYTPIGRRSTMRRLSFRLSPRDVPYTGAGILPVLPSRQSFFRTPGSHRLRRMNRL